MLGRTAVALITIILCPLVVWACKYSVRDVGFVALDENHYELRLVVSSEMEEENLEALRSEFAPLLRDTNIQLNILKSDSPRLTSREIAQPVEGDRAAAWMIDHFKPREEAAAAEAPRELNFEPVNINDKSSLTSFLWEMADSDLRSQLITAALKSHSVLVIVEGSNVEHNQQATELAADARKEVATSLPDLPKPVDHPTEIISLKKENRAAERLLLWSWNIDPDNIDQTWLVPIFGRGRLLGEPLAVPGTSLTELSTILSYVGQDCECELDRSWMQGKMFPHRWDEAQEAIAAKALDFDPGSPLVKSEITRILARGPNGRRNLNVGVESEGDLLQLSQTEEGNVTAEEADDILRELNILPAEEDYETDSETTSTDEVALAEAEPTPTESIEKNAPATAASPVPATEQADEANFTMPEAYQRTFEIVGALMMLFVLFILFRSRRGRKS
ncbi:MAG: hypothetical protein CMJ46_02295 [Planctomyces sp.]|nr:hypothetical protein [Planctomyces sp.]